MRGASLLSSVQLNTSFLLLLKQFQADFVHLESLFLLVSETPQFPVFLKNYGGLARRNSTQAELIWLEEISGRFGAELVSFFGTLFSTQLNLTQFSVRQISELLAAFEGAVNLALYKWCGGNDRNFQFRTLVHFYGLEDLGDLLFESAGTSFFVSFSEDGMRFGPSESQHIPACLPASTACALWQLSSPQAFETQQDSIVFARLRTVQQEICFLVDEWEHRNTLLAVEHTFAREDYRAQPSPETQTLFQKTLQKMSVHRDRLAQWCLLSFLEFQEFLADAQQYSKHNPDIVAEIHATDALLLSGIQKIFLPASVSRHKYDRHVALKILEWCQARQKSHPEDLALQMVRVSMSLALGHADSADFISILLESKSYEWKLDFDPCPGLKTFCWLLNANDFAVVTIAALCAFSKKLNPNSLDSYCLSNLASLAQMPETFMPDTPLTLPSRLSVPAPLFARLKETATDALSRVGQGEEQQQCRQFLHDFISHEGA